MGALCYQVMQVTQELAHALRNQGKIALDEENDMPTLKTIKNSSKTASRSRVLRGSEVMTASELHKSMMAYGKKVSADRESALAFLKRIGAPV